MLLACRTKAGIWKGGSSCPATITTVAELAAGLQHASGSIAFLSIVQEETRHLDMHIRGALRGSLASRPLSTLTMYRLIELWLS